MQDRSYTCFPTLYNIRNYLIPRVCVRYIDEVVFCRVQKIFELLASHKKNTRSRYYGWKLNDEKMLCLQYFHYIAFNQTQTNDKTSYKQFMRLVMISYELVTWNTLRETGQFTTRLGLKYLFTDLLLNNTCIH